MTNISGTPTSGGGGSDRAEKQCPTCDGTGKVKHGLFAGMPCYDCKQWFVDSGRTNLMADKHIT